MSPVTPSSKTNSSAANLTLLSSDAASASRRTPGSTSGTASAGASASVRPAARPTPGSRPAQAVPRRVADDPFAADGRSTRWADHREARRAELVRIARRTVHHHGPDVSMEEIASAAGTSKSIVYRYFADKTGLQIAVAEAVVLQIQGALEGVLRVAPTPRDGLRAMVAVYLEMIESSPHVYAFVTRNGSVESGGPLGHFLDSVTALVAAPFARGLTQEGSDGRRYARRPEASPDDATSARIALAESWAAGAVGFVRGAGEWWLAHREEPGSPDREDITAQVAAWLWAGPVGLLARERTRVDVSWSAQAVEHPNPFDLHDDASSTTVGDTDEHTRGTADEPAGTSTTREIR